MPASVKIPAQFIAVDRFSGVIKSMSIGVKKFSTVGISAIKRFDTKISQSFNRMSRFSQMAVGLGIGAVFSTAIQSNIAYNDSLMEVSSITGATGKSLAILEGHAMNVAKATKMMGSDVLKGFTEIASAKPELLKTPKALADITQQAIILSKASKLDLKTAADSLTTSLNQFGLGSNMAKMAIDALSAGSVYGASKIPETADALAKFGTIAAATGTKLNESIALVQLVSPFEKGAEAGTKLRNILGKIAGAKILPKDQIGMVKKMGVNMNLITNAALPLNDRLLEFSKIASDSNTVMKVFGTENAAMAQALLNNAGGFAGMLANVNQTGMAADQANKNMSAFGARLTAMKNQFLNVTTATNSDNKALALLGKTMDYVSENMDIIVGIGASAIGMFGAMKAVIWGTQAATVAYNLVLGAQAALSGTASIAIGKNAVALGAYKTVQVSSTAVTWLAAAATTAFGVAMNLGLWPILAIIAAVVGVIAIFKNWDKITAWFGKQWGKFTGWLSEAWTNVVNWFKEFDFTKFFKDIGQSILRFVLAPMKMMLSLASNIPGKIGDMATKALTKIGNITGDGNIAINDARKPIDGPEIQMIQSNERVRESLMKASLNVNFNDPGQMVKSIDQGPSSIPVKLTRTQGAF